MGTVIERPFRLRLTPEPKRKRGLVSLANHLLSLTTWTPNQVRRLEKIQDYLSTYMEAESDLLDRISVALCEYRRLQKARLYPRHAWYQPERYCRKTRAERIKQKIKTVLDERVRIAQRNVARFKTFKVRYRRWNENLDSDPIFRRYMTYWDRLNRVYWIGT